MSHHLGGLQSIMAGRHGGAGKLMAVCVGCERQLFTFWRTRKWRVRQEPGWARSFKGYS